MSVQQRGTGESDTARVEPIKLIDHTKQATDENTQPDTPADDDTPLSAKATRVSVHLREEISRRKWAKYQQDRTASSHKRKRSTGSTLSPLRASDDLGRPSSDVETGQEEQVETASESSDRWGESHFDRGARRVRNAKDRVREHLPKLHTQHHSTLPEYLAHGRNKDHPDNEQESAIDILYENQRGTFILGLPRFSSRSLLQFDAPAWTDGNTGKPSGCDIRDAQVPDPSWRWDWRTWYVDMSRDVDEEGWEYALWFRKRAAWHGNHPWLLSFVRRRRWLRKRVRDRHDGALVDAEVEKAHAMNPDYFTIHSKKKREGGGARPMSPGSEAVMSAGRSSRAPPTSASWGAKDWKEQEEEEFGEIASVPALMKALRHATVDREKLIYVQRFLEQGGDELHYLADEMPEIMGMFVFQNSRRQLLAILQQRIGDAEQQQGEQRQKREEDSDKEQKYIDDLQRGAEAAEQQCKKLEYWSDVKIVSSGEEASSASAQAEAMGDGSQGIGSDGSRTPVPSSPPIRLPAEPSVDKGKAKLEGSSEDTKISPEQLLKRRNTPGVWRDSSERATSEESETHGTSTLRAHDENQSPSRSSEANKQTAESQRDVSRMGKIRVSSSEEEPAVEQALRRRSTPGMWIDGAADNTSTGAGTDVADMNPTSEEAKAVHEREHADAGADERLAGAERAQAERYSGKSDDGDGGKEQERPPPQNMSAEAQVSENLAILQAELERDDAESDDVTQAAQHKP